MSPCWQRHKSCSNVPTLLVRDEAKIKVPRSHRIFVGRHSELCNQNRNEKYRQKDRPDWYFNKCLIPKVKGKIIRPYWLCLKSPRNKSAIDQQ